ncbi:MULTISPECIES: DUF2975 domain-containing protein [unclassified Gilliamella]|uniref:DUF2975 domain-containing protein n=1 Tax=unclassified Gilliamella TaxID=2685620 RepID=UPI0022698438|nr:MULTISPECIES: DUF2975 domain-containing protein [unclassified Gilliamella]MCX8643043.1 DUF2975 domain-containing protein [Gilliamella sp. B3835]MCX8708434.1 DUF2975 domain-containing protein [Gilliamella sp. B3783]MCX8709690.1 DUF2975 domain-containing protein [Gilliamella sp. B3780]MCX8714122.1 DUF2975 domain-containing protein [Gilliamella sp. B3781]MCX8717630.1 DUF2975 domain-containing protein [Gilliamella sp. B3784]
MNTTLARSNLRLNQYCRFMVLLTTLIIIVMLIGALSPLLYYFFNIENIGLASGGYSFFISNSVDVDPTELEPWQAFLATLIDTVEIFILIYAFYQLRLLFLKYSQSDFFSERSANHCYIFGKMLVIWSIVSILSEPLLTLILSFNQAERYFSFSFTSDDIMVLFPAISIMVIGQILKKACQLAEENQQFV